MKTKTILTDAGQQYEAAYAMHYTTKDLHKAFVLYGRIIATHPDTMEAEYSWSQIQNIVNAVVPKQKIMAALEELTIAQFEQDVQLNVEPDSNMTIASE